jgi:hypothetical protein
MRPWSKALFAGVLSSGALRRPCGVRRLGRPSEVRDLRRDRIYAPHRSFASDTRWTVVRGSDLEEGESQGLPVWSRHVGDPILESLGIRPFDPDQPDQLDLYMLTSEIEATLQGAR